MDKRPIEQQVAELTPEQKDNMGKIYKKYIKSLILVVVIALLAGIGLFAEASINEKKAKDKHDELQTKIELNEMTNSFDLDLYDESKEALDEYYDAQQRKNSAFTMGAAVILVGTLIVFFTFKKKYPYFSEKKYLYLKKTEKALG